MLIVLNELQNSGENRLSNFDALKSILTDNTIRVNEKNQPRRTAQNVANFIFVTNNAFPVKIEVSDRRYVVLVVSGHRAKDFGYFNNLIRSFTSEFYTDLLTFYANRDITNFNPRDIPMTEEKQDIIDASRSEIDVWIQAHYDELVTGMKCENAQCMKPDSITLKNFQLQLKNKCDRKQIRVGARNDNKRAWVYMLKREYVDIYIPKEYVDQIVEAWIRENYGDMVEGVDIGDILDIRPQGISENVFISQIEKLCLKTGNELKLKEEYVNLYGV
jgi:hypothetical protein